MLSLKKNIYYAAHLPRRGRILRRTLSVCPSVCLSVRPSRYLSLPSVTWRHLANYNDTHVLFGSRRGPHIVRPSRPHKLVWTNSCNIWVQSTSKNIPTLKTSPYIFLPTSNHILSRRRRGRRGRRAVGWSIAADHCQATLLLLPPDAPPPGPCHQQPTLILFDVGLYRMLTRVQFAVYLTLTFLLKSVLLK